MEELDGDVVRLSSRGKYAERDIVQVRLEKKYSDIVILLNVHCVCMCFLVVLLSPNKNRVLKRWGQVSFPPTPIDFSGAAFFYLPLESTKLSNPIDFKGRRQAGTEWDLLLK